MTQGLYLGGGRLFCINGEAAIIRAQDLPVPNGREADSLTAQTVAAVKARKAMKAMKAKPKSKAMKAMKAMKA